MRSLLLVALLFPAFALGNVTRTKPEPEQMLSNRHFAGVVTATSYDGATVGDRPVMVTAVRTRCGTAASGVGNIVWRVTDGTRNCDCTIACTGTGRLGYGDSGAKIAACTGSCVFPSGADLVLSVQTAGCASTQPNITHMQVWGKAL